MNALPGEWRALTAGGCNRLAAERVLGYHIAQKKTGHACYPLAYQLQDRQGHPVAHLGGGFFGWGWHETEEAAWLACPRFTTDPGADYYMFTVACGWPRARKASFLVSELIGQGAGPLSCWAAGLEEYQVGDFTFAACVTVEDVARQGPGPARAPAARGARPGGHR